MAPGRRERKKQATRDALGLAVLELSLEHGIENVTIEQIATTADVTPRTFFNHFGSKEDAIVEAIQDELYLEESARRSKRWTRYLRARPAGEPVVAAVRAAYRDSARDAGPTFHLAVRAWRMAFAALSLKTRRINLLSEWEERSLAEAISERLAAHPEGDVDADLLAACGFAAMRLAAIRFFNDPDASDGRRLYVMTDALLAQLERGYGQARSAETKPQ